VGRFFPAAFLSLAKGSLVEHLWNMGCVFSSQVPEISRFRNFRVARNPIGIEHTIYERTNHRSFKNDNHRQEAGTRRRMPLLFSRG
jgi:hypothetical protein